MALVQCKECKAQISNTAKACPQCGAKLPAKTSIVTMMVGALIIFGLLKVLLSDSGQAAAPTKTPAQLAQESKKEADFQNVVRVAKWAKGRSKNPDSFTLTYGGITQAGTVCIEFRGTNSFNAVVPGRYIMSDSVSGDTVQLWNKHCANKPITDFSYARQAL